MRKENVKVIIWGLGAMGEEWLKCYWIKKELRLPV